MQVVGGLQDNELFSEIHRMVSHCCETSGLEIVGVRVQSMIHSLIPKAACSKRRFLSFLCKTREICLPDLVSFFSSFLWGWGGWEWRLFFCLFCLCLWASFPVSLILSVWEIHTNMVSPKHEGLGSLWFWTWQWKQWYPLPLVRAESCGWHCLACLPSGYVGRMTTCTGMDRYEDSEHS